MKLQCSQVQYTSSPNVRKRLFGTDSNIFILFRNINNKNKCKIAFFCNIVEPTRQQNNRTEIKTQDYCSSTQTVTFSRHGSLMPERPGAWCAVCVLRVSSSCSAFASSSGVFEPVCCSDSSSDQQNNPGIIGVSRSTVNTTFPAFFSGPSVHVERCQAVIVHLASAAASAALAAGGRALCTLHSCPPAVSWRQGRFILAHNLRRRISTFRDTRM